MLVAVNFNFFNYVITIQVDVMKEKKSLIGRFYLRTSVVGAESCLFYQYSEIAVHINMHLCAP